MKKLSSILVLVFAFTITAQAQKKGKKFNGEKLSTEQQTTLAVKKMTLKLDLTEAQQRQIKPLLAEQFADRKAKFEKRKNAKKEGVKISADERFTKENIRLDKEIAMQKKMKSILNADQYEQFKKMKHQRKSKAKKQGKKKMMMKKGKMKKERKELKRE